MISKPSTFWAKYLAKLHCHINIEILYKPNYFDPSTSTACAIIASIRILLKRYYCDRDFQIALHDLFGYSGYCDLDPGIKPVRTYTMWPSLHTFTVMWH